MINLTSVSTESGQTFTLQACASTALTAFGYAPDTRELCAVFAPEPSVLYVYEGVTLAEFALLSEAPSKGRAINLIKQAHPVRKEILCG